MSDPSPLLSALDRALGPSRVETDPAACARFARDESEAASVPPVAVVHAAGADDVARALEACSRHDAFAFPRGAGTGRAGGATVTRPRGVVIDTTRMAAIKDIDRANQVCVVEPGVITGALQDAVEAEGLFFPPDPQSAAECTLGGNIATNAGGPRAFRYGVTRDYVLGLDAVLADGTRTRVGKRTVKGVTGYDVTALLVGSEGTLAVFTEATLRLVPRPPELRTLLAVFASATDAAQAVANVVARGLTPRCLELLDRECCDAARDGGADVPAGAGALVIAEVDGEGPSLDAQLERLGEACAAARATTIAAARGEAERERLWRARKAMSRALRARARFKMSEDVVVPRARLAEMYARIERIAASHALRLPAYGHAGDGNLHVNILWDDEDGRPRVARAIEDVFRATIALGGTLTGEHGLGALKTPYLPLEQGDELIELQRRIKSAFDPRGVLNPGKMLPARGGHGAC